MKYIIKRLLESLLTVFIIASLVFVLLRCLPVEKFFSEEELQVLSKEEMHEILEAEGLLDPLPEQLMRFYGELLRLDLGESRRIKQDVPVTQIIGDRYGISMKFGLVSLLISLTLGVIIGMIQAQYVDKWPDNLGFAYTVLVRAVPGLVTYSLICLLGSKYLGLPSIYSIKKPIVSAIMPIVCLSLSLIHI